MFDCRVEDSHKDWAVTGEVERVLWNHFSPFHFLVSVCHTSVSVVLVAVVLIVVKITKIITY